MALLLDTHVLVWTMGDRRRLSAAVLDALQTTGGPIMVSAATAWEFEGLAARSRLGSVGSFADVQQALEITLLDLPGDIWRLIRQLPDLHRDPIDRMVIAHAIHAELTLVTADVTMRAYPVRTLW